MKKNILICRNKKGLIGEIMVSIPVMLIVFVIMALFIIAVVFAGKLIGGLGATEAVKLPAGEAGEDILLKEIKMTSGGVEKEVLFLDYIFATWDSKEENSDVEVSLDKNSLNGLECFDVLSFPHNKDSKRLRTNYAFDMRLNKNGEYNLLKKSMNNEGEVISTDLRLFINSMEKKYENGKFGEYNIYWRNDLYDREVEMKMYVYSGGECK